MSKIIPSRDSATRHSNSPSSIPGQSFSARHSEGPGMQESDCRIGPELGQGKSGDRSFSISTHKKTVSTKDCTGGGCEVAFFADGVKTFGNQLPVSKKALEALQNSERGTIKGWSAASRRRMREFLLTSALPEGYHCAGVTFTIPGPNMPEKTVAKLWDNVQHKIRRGAGLAVWRRELQKRGQQHWHLLTGLTGAKETVCDRWREIWLSSLKALGRVVYDTPQPWSNKGEFLPYSESTGTDKFELLSERATKTNKATDWYFYGRLQGSSRAAPDGYIYVKYLWMGGKKTFLMNEAGARKVLQSDTPICCRGRIKLFYQKQYRREVFHLDAIEKKLPSWWPNKTCLIWNGLVCCGYPDLSEWANAHKNSCDVELQRPSGAWKRYLQDHATKHKQEQIAENIGRHWGVIGRKEWRAQAPVSVARFPDQRSYTKFLRAFRRLRTPMIVCPLAPFGRKLGHVPGKHSGLIGNRVFFSDPETIKRIAKWAIRERGTELGIERKNQKRPEMP